MKKLMMVLVVFFTANSNAQTETPFEIENEGWILKGDLRMPQGEPKALALLFHNAAGNRTEYTSFATRLEMAGIASLRVDLRANGESTNLDTFDYKVRKNFEINEGAFRDIAVIHQWAKGDLRFQNLPIISVSASYSGEKAANAIDISGSADAYIQLAPGSFSEESTRKIEPTGVPWLFVRAEEEFDFFDDIFDLIGELAPSAERWYIPGSGHATDILIGRPELEARIIKWIKKKTLPR